MTHITRFDKRLSQIPNEIWSKVTQIEELKGRWIQGTNLSPQFLSRLKRSVLITSTGASTRIEGANLSDEAVDDLMRGIAIEKFTNREKEEVRGYFELLQNIFNSWEDLGFTEGSIKHLHKELLKYTEKDVLHRGNYKNADNKVQMVDGKGRAIGVIFDTTLSYLTPKEMNELVDWTKKALSDKKYHPLLIIGNFIVEFLNIHPFKDGNGRLSRILTNMLLLKEGYLYMPYISHEKLIEDNKPEYYMALRTSQKTFKSKNEDITAWLSFFLTILLTQSQMAINLITEENIEVLLSPKQLAVWQYLQEVGDASPNDIVKNVRIARITVNQVLNKLLNMKKVERIGEGSGIRYRKK
ncbi:MAG: Fic family protein [Candidatus Daviesbacteria bacterium]|nr:Fic family protein [Candidatus Daviesbacteria bacterium]